MYYAARASPSQSLQESRVDESKLNHLARTCLQEEREKKQAEITRLTETLGRKQFELSKQQTSLADSVARLQSQVAAQPWDDARKARYLENQKQPFLAMIRMIENDIVYLRAQLKTIQAKQPQVIHQDDNFVILSGALVPRDKVDEGSQKSIAGDAIKFIAVGNNVHFIQFVTHHAYSEESGWVHPVNYFTLDPKSPQWRVDGEATTQKNLLDDPYYDSYGVCDRRDRYLAIYDEPGTTMDTNERIVFNTFLIIDNTLMRGIQWSRQFDSNNNLFYQFGAITQDNLLPNWAITTCKDDPLTSNSDRGQKLTYRLPKELDRPVSSVAEDPTHLKLESSFLAPSPQWKIVQQHPEIFGQSSSRPSYPSILSTFGVRENKATGPRVASALDQIKDAHGAEKALEVADQFSKWATYHNRRFNMQEINSFIDSNNRSSITPK